MINITTLTNDLANKTTEEGIKIIGEVFLPSVLIAWAVLIILTVIIAVCILKKKKGFQNFFLIFILPQLVFLVLILFIFIIPILPKWTSELMKGWLTG